MTTGPLRIDFTMNHGHEMVVDRVSGIMRTELDEVEVCMLQSSQRIPNLLQLSWSDLDGALTFRYPLAGKRMLLHCLQTEPFGMADFYALLLAVVETLDDCKDFMLRPDGFLLHEQAVFIGSRFDDVALCYVPVKEPCNAGTAEEALLALAVRWIGYVNHPEGAGLQQVFRHLREERIIWGEFRRTLLQLVSAPHRRDTEPVIREGNDNTGRSAFEALQVADYQPMTGERTFANEVPFSGDVPALSNDEDVPLKMLQNPPADSRGKWLLGAGFVVAVAFLWRYLYVDSPSRNGMLVSAGLTLLAAAGFIIIWRKRFGERMLPEDAALWKKEEDGGASAESYIEDEFLPDSASHRPLSSLLSNRPRFQLGQEGAEAMPPINNGLEVQISDCQQVVKPPVQAGPTVCLGDRSGPEDTSAGKPFLERKAEGRTERLELDESRFVIGRSVGGAGYVDASHGISRAHLEIMANGEQWIAKDVGSRNGTTLNGETMIPYKAYVLKNGDMLQLAGEKGPEYVFRT